LNGEIPNFPDFGNAPLRLNTSAVNEGANLCFFLFPFFAFPSYPNPKPKTGNPKLGRLIGADEGKDILGIEYVGYEGIESFGIDVTGDIGDVGYEGT